MAYRDDSKNALAILKLARANRILVGAITDMLVPDQSTADAIAEADALIASAERDARNVDNGALRDMEVKA